MLEDSFKMEILSIFLFMIGYYGISAKNPGTIPPNKDIPEASHVIISHNVKDKSTSIQDITNEQEILSTVEVPVVNNIELNDTSLQNPSNLTETPDSSNIWNFQNVTSKISNSHDHKNNKSKLDTSTPKMPHTKLSTIKHSEIKKKGQIPEESPHSNSTKPSKIITVKHSSTSLVSKKSPTLKHSENKVIANSPKTIELSSEPDNLQSTNSQNDSDLDSTTTTKIKKSQSKSSIIISKTNSEITDSEIDRAKLVESTENNADLEEMSDHEETTSKSLPIVIPPKRFLEIDKTEKLHTQINNDRISTIKPKSRLTSTKKLRNQTTKISNSITTDFENESESTPLDLFTTLPSESEEILPVWQFTSVRPDKNVWSTQKFESTEASPNQSPEVKHKTSLSAQPKRKPILKSESEEITPVSEFTLVHPDKNILSTQIFEPNEAPPNQSSEVKQKTSLPAQSKKRPMLKSEKQKSSSGKKLEVSSINSLEGDVIPKEFDSHSTSLNNEGTSISWISTTPFPLDEPASIKLEKNSDIQSQDPSLIFPSINKLAPTDGKFSEAEWATTPHSDLTILKNESDLKDNNSQPIDKNLNFPTQLTTSDKSSSTHWPASWNINPSTEWAILDKTVELPKRSENDQAELVNIKKNGAKEWTNSWSQFSSEVTKPSNFPIASSHTIDRRTWPTDTSISPFWSHNPSDSQTLPSKEPDKNIWSPHSDTQTRPSQQPNSQLLTFPKQEEQIKKQSNTQTQLLQNPNIQTWPAQNINLQTLPPQNINTQPWSSQISNANTLPSQNINTQPWHPQNINSQTWPPQNSNIQTWPSQNKFVQTRPIDSPNFQSSSLAPNQQTLSSIPSNLRTQPSMIFNMQTTSPDRPPWLSMQPNMQSSQSMISKRQTSTFPPPQIQEGRSIAPSLQAGPPSELNKQTWPPRTINDDIQSSKQSNLQQWPPKPSLKVVTWPKGSGLSDPWMPITSDVKPSGRELKN